MALPWPTLIPLPQQSISSTIDNANVQTQMDSGRIRQRPLYTENVERSDITFVFDEIEYAFFKAFWRERISNGADWFLITLPVGDGEILTESEVRFTTGYGVDYTAFQRYEVTATIEFRKTPNLPADVMDVIDSEGFDTEDYEAAVLDFANEVNHFHLEHPLS